MKNEVSRLGIRLHSAESQQEFAIKRDKEVQEATQRADKYYGELTEVISKLNMAEERLLVAQRDRKKLVVLQLCLGLGIGGILGLYVHRAAQAIAYEIDGLEGESIEEKRNRLMKFLTNDMFKPLAIITACLSSYGATLL